MRNYNLLGTGDFVPAAWLTAEYAYASITYDSLDDRPLPLAGHLVFPLWPMKAVGTDDWIRPGVIQTVTCVCGSGTGAELEYFFQGRPGMWRINTNDQPWRSATEIIARGAEPARDVGREATEEAARIFGR